jgi:hypothetical protein
MDTLFSDIVGRCVDRDRFDSNSLPAGRAGRSSRVPDADAPSEPATAKCVATAALTVAAVARLGQ